MLGSSGDYGLLRFDGSTFQPFNKYWTASNMPDTVPQLVGSPVKALSPKLGGCVWNNTSIIVSAF